MSSTGTPTLNYGLNQWEGTDKPEGEDFNEDNRKIDTALRNKADITSGTWIPVLAGGKVAGANTYSQQVGVWTKIGKRVFLDFIVVLSLKDTNMAGPILVKGNLTIVLAQHKAIWMPKHKQREFC